MATANLNEPTSAADGNIPFIGTAADDGTGNTLREAISRINARLRELYGAQDASNVVQTPFVDNDNIKDDVIKEPKLDVTNAPVDGYVLTYDSATTGFTWEQKFDGDITGIVAGNGLTGDATSGDATLNVGAGTGITVNADDIQISNNGVDHDQLADRYTAVQTIPTTTATVNLDASSYSVFNITANLQSTQTLNLQNMKTGQVIDILATGTSTLTLTSDDTSETFNNLGAVTYDGSSNNHIQIVCIDDTDSAAIYNYTIQTYTSDNTPN